MKWREIEISEPKPKPRRRHSAIFLSGSLAMFGGFDGGFYNDLNILDLESTKSSIIDVPKSTICQDYLSLVNNQDGADIIFLLNDSQRSKIYSHRALILFRLI
jgi:hypothetical protein